MGKSSKRKGSNYERRIVQDHQDVGIVAHRVPHSGAMSNYPGDVIIGDRLQGEVKARKLARGFKRVRDWLADNHVLFLQEIAKQGSASPKSLVVTHWRYYVEALHALDFRRRAFTIWQQANDPSEAAQQVMELLARERDQYVCDVCETLVPYRVEFFEGVGTLCRACHEEEDS